MDGCRSMETFSRHSSRCCCCCFCHFSFGVILIFVFAMGVSLLCDCTVEASNFPNEERGHVHRKKLTETDKGNTLPQSVELKEVGNKEEKPLNA